MAARYPSRLREAAKPSIYDPLGPARRRSSIFGAAKYVSNIVSPVIGLAAAGSQSSTRTSISGAPILWGAKGGKVVRKHLKVSRIGHLAARQLTITEFAHKARNGHRPLRAATAIPTKMLWGERRGYCNFGAVQRLPMELLMSQAFDASKSLIALD